MSDGFSNPIIGGGGGLVYPSIHSPRFNVANPLASPSPAWGILKNGLAYFLGLVLSGGTIMGPNYILNSAGFFLYSGAPAAGNLVISITTAAGVDGFGNPYKADVTVYGTAGSTVNLLAGPSAASLFIGTGDAAETSKAVFSSAVAGAGVTRQLEVLLQGPSVSTTSPNDGLITIDIASGSVDQVSEQPFLDLIAKSNNGLSLLDIFLSPFVFAVGSSLTITPGQTAVFGLPVALTDSAAPALPATGAALYSTAGQLKYEDEAGVTYDTGRITAFKAGNQAVSTVALVALAGMSVAVGPGTYHVRVQLQLKANAAAGQWQASLSGPAASLVSLMTKWTSAAGAMALTANVGALPATVTGPNPSVLGFYEAIIEGEITFTAAGNLAVSGLTTVAADTWNCFAGSSVEAFPVV